MQIQTHKIHHDLDLGEATTLPLIVYFVPLHEAHIQMTFCLETPKWESQNSQSLPITLHANFWLKWGLKKSCSPCWELSKNMSHTTSTRENRGDSWLLVVGSQIGKLTPNPSFGHNLCFKCLNGSCKPILDIYVSINFQWYKKILNPLSFDPYNHFLKI
jgi:hypothetical protein